MIRHKVTSILLAFIFVNVCYGLDRTRQNVYQANQNFLASESGQNNPQTNDQKTSKPGSIGQVSGNQGKPPSSTQMPGSHNQHSNSNPNDKSGGSVNNGRIPENGGTDKNNKNDGINGHQSTSTTTTKKPQTQQNDKNRGSGIWGDKNNSPMGSSTTTTTTESPGRKPSYSQVASGSNKGLTTTTKAPGGRPSYTQTPSRANRGPTTNNPAGGRPSYSQVAAGGKNGQNTNQQNRNRPNTNENGNGGYTNPQNNNRNPSSSLPSSILANQGDRSRGNETSDSDLLRLSEELLRKDTNNVAKLIKVNYQQKTTADSKDDKAPQPLFNVPESVLNGPTIQKFVALLDNYERDSLVNEYVTAQEKNEENAFMDAIMQTQVMRTLMSYLRDKGIVSPDPKVQRDYLKQMWFSLYSRGKGKIGSSGFEHVFVSELKNNQVSGLHNWLYFSKEEAANRVNYLGYLKYSDFDKGSVLKLHFNQQGVDKPVESMFVGTSPELEIALYSLCFITRADKDCPLKLNGKDIKIVTHTFRYRSKNLIGSAYPVIA